MNYTREILDYGDILEKWPEVGHLGVSALKFILHTKDIYVTKTGDWTVLNKSDPNPSVDFRIRICSGSPDYHYELCYAHLNHLVTKKMRPSELMKQTGLDPEVLRDIKEDSRAFFTFIGSDVRPLTGVETLRSDLLQNRNCFEVKHVPRTGFSVMLPVAAPLHPSE